MILKQDVSEVVGLEENGQEWSKKIVIEVNVERYEGKIEGCGCVILLPGNAYSCTMVL